MGDLIKYVAVVPPRAADGVTFRVYSQSKQEIGRLVEAVTVFSADTDLLKATWAAFREPLLAAGRASRVSKEAVAAAVSRSNQCDYCVDAHSIMLYGGGARGLAEQLLSGVETGDLEAQYAELCGWAQDSATAATARSAPPYPPAQAAEYLGVLVYFHFLNRVINVLIDGTFLPGSARARRIARRVGGRLMARNVAADYAPGVAVGLVEAPLPMPGDLAWAAPSPGIAAAFSMLAASVEAAAATALPPRVAALVEVAVAGWRGERFGPSAAWVNGYLSGVPDEDRPAARLALLVAFAPFQVTEQDVAAYRAAYPADRQLLGLVAWSAFCAARRVGEWTAAAMDTVQT